MPASDFELQNMVKMFRVCDLQHLLVYARINIYGRKDVLQERALRLISLNSTDIDLKIRELYKRHQQPRYSEQEMYHLAPINDPIRNNDSGTSNLTVPSGSAVGISGSVPQINHQMRCFRPALNVISQSPINHEVTFKYLPFYDVLAELLKPTSLATLKVVGCVQEKELSFYLRPQDINQLNSSSDFQVQLRIGISVSNCGQEDEFPTNGWLKINHRAMLLNAIPIKMPVDITSRVKRSTIEPQLVCVSWPSSNCKPYVMGVFLVRKKTSYALLKRLKDNCVKNPDYTIAMIKEKLCCDRNSDIATMSLRGSLLCPLGKNKMILPCRATTCTHLQCFDAHLYIQMNEKYPKWICPVCNNPAAFGSLAIDGLFLDISTKVPSKCTEVEFLENGSWTPVMPVKMASKILETTIQVETPKVEKQKEPVEIINLSDSITGNSFFENSRQSPSDCTEVQFQRNRPWTPVKKVAEVMKSTFQSETPKVEKQKKPVEIICLSDSDSEESWSLQQRKKNPKTLRAATLFRC